MDEVFDQALTDYFYNRQQQPLLINNTYGPADEMDLAAYFRTEEDLLSLETYALGLVQGKTLDVGAGAGALALILQNRGIEITALEQSAAACNIMRSRGVAEICNHNFFTFNPEGQYDTLLMMMNGLGICQTMDRLPALFARFADLLTANGQVLFDSSDVRYVYEQGLPADRYFGEMDYQYEYRGRPCS